MSELKKTTMPILGPNKHCFGSGFFCLDLDWTFFPESNSGSGQNPDPLKNAFLFWFLQNLIKEHNKDLSKLLTNHVIFGLKILQMVYCGLVSIFLVQAYKAKTEESGSRFLKSKHGSAKNPDPSRSDTLQKTCVAFQFLIFFLQFFFDVKYVKVFESFSKQY